MSPVVLASGMVLASGAAHAIVNATLKSGSDKMSSRALIDGFSGLIILPAAFLVPLPTSAWVWLAASGAIHLVYLYSLIQAFERADMMVTYPLLRGIAPGLASLVAVAFFAEPITWPIAIGVACVSAGVMVAALGRHLDRTALVYSLVCGASIALYTVADAQGVRAAPTAPSYIVWIFLVDGGIIGGLFALWRGPRFILSARSEWRAGLAAGALSIVSYGLALWAYRLADIPRLSALRETSILFGVVIAVVFLRERVTAARLASAGLIAAGALVLLATG